MQDFFDSIPDDQWKIKEVLFSSNLSNLQLQI